MPTTSRALPFLLPLLLCLAVLTLCACGKQWTNPDIADPRKEDEILAEDKAFCEKFAQQKYSTGVTQEEVSDRVLSGEPDYDREIDDWDTHVKNVDYFDQCMRGRGWESAD